MGADLYIKKLYKPNVEKYEPVFNEAVARRNALKVKEGDPKYDAAQREVSKAYAKMYSQGYFRDPYNGSGLFSWLVLSWWQDVSNKLTDSDGVMSVENAKKLLEKVRKAKMRPVTAETLKEARCEVDDGENSPASWQKSILEHRMELEKFLETAIELNEPIDCSL